MTSFETYLISKGYIKHIYNCKKQRLERTDKHIISTMVNLDHRYIKNDVEIIFGLHEYGKPPTLIYPRPKIRVKKYNSDNEIVIETELHDDSMNLVLQKVDDDILYNSLFNKVTFEYDLTKNVNN